MASFFETDVASFFDLLSRVEKNAEKKKRDATTRLIQNGPATVIVWGDGSKTVSKLRDGDHYDSLVGVLNCVVRRLTHNHDHGVDDNERVMRQIAKRAVNVKGLRVVRENLRFIMDVIDTAIDVMERDEGQREKLPCLVDGLDNVLSGDEGHMNLDNQYDIVKIIKIGEDGGECHG